MEDEKQNLKNENEILNNKLLELQNYIYKIQNILEDIKLNNLNIVPSKNESLEKIVDNLNVGQAIEDIHKIINTITNNIDNMNNRNINLINNSYVSEEILIKSNKNSSMDKDDKDIIKNLNSFKEKKPSRNEFNPKIEQIISFHDRNNNYNNINNLNNLNNINNDNFNINTTFSLNNTERKLKDDNLAKIANSLGKKTIKKKQYKREQKFLNRFVNVEK